MKYQTNHSFEKNSTFRIGFKLRLKFLISPTLLHPNNFPPCYFSINTITFTERISPVSILTAFPNLIFTRSRESSRADYFAVISNTRYTPDISDIPVTSIHTQRISNYQVFSKTREKIPWTMPGSITIEIRDGKSYPTGRMHPSEMHLNRA